MAAIQSLASCSAGAAVGAARFTGAVHRRMAPRRTRLLFSRLAKGQIGEATDASHSESEVSPGRAGPVAAGTLPRSLLNGLRKARKALLKRFWMS